MITPDTNILIYAYDKESPFHVAAKDWLTGSLNGTEPFAFTWLAIAGFLRVTTNGQIYKTARTLENAVEIVDGWLSRENVLLLTETDRHWLIFSGLLRTAEKAGPFVTDIHLAALAIEHDATIASADRDFERFRGLKLVNPLRVGEV